MGFEPTVPCEITGFQDQLLKPLGHLSSSEEVPVTRNVYYIITEASVCQQVFEIFSENFSGGRKMEGETVRRAVNRGLAGKIACQEPYTL